MYFLAAGNILQDLGFIMYSLQACMFSQSG